MTRVNFTSADLRAIADALDALGGMRTTGVEPGNSYESPKIAHGDTTLTLGWNEPDAASDHYVITDVD